jgi:hypothetical protein
MKRAYKRRPEDFKRRILSIHDDRSELLDEELRVLKMIKDDAKHDYVFVAARWIVVGKGDIINQTGEQP